MNAQLTFACLCLVVMTSGLPISNRSRRTSACVASRDHSAGTCEASGPSSSQCGASPYWLRPCAGCSRGSEIGPGHPLYPTTPTSNLQCLMDTFIAMEKDLKYIMNMSANLNRDFGSVDSEQQAITLAHKYNVPTNFPCRQGQNVTEWIQEWMATFAPHWEEVYKGENKNVLDIAADGDCRVSRATNDTRKNIGDMLCQLSSVELGHNPIDTCAENYTGSGACYAPNTSGVERDIMTRFSRDKVVNLYFQKFIRKAMRLL